MFYTLLTERLKLYFNKYINKKIEKNNCILNYYSPALFVYCTKIKFFRINISFFSITTRILKFLIIIFSILFIIIITYSKFIIIEFFVLWILLFIYFIIFVFFLYFLNIFYINNKIFDKNK